MKWARDDYIVKPFSPREVVSRIKAVLRRTCAAPDTAQDEKLTTLTYGSLEIQPERYSVKLAGQSVACTPREVELLYLLASHPGRVFDREQILSRIWGYDFFGRHAHGRYPHQAPAPKAHLRGDGAEMGYHHRLRRGL